MRAAVLRKQRFHVEQVPRPSPGPGEVLIRVRACGICGSDLHFVKHADQMLEQARQLGAPTAELERGLATGLVLGHEFVGEVVELGAGAGTLVQIGDRVCSMPFVLKGTGSALIGSNPETSGAYAEYMVLTEALCLKVPADVPDEAAALTEPLGIAVHAVNGATMQPGDIAVVIGCGPIGLAITALLKIRGVTTIYATDLSPRRRDLAQALGATQVVDGREASAVQLAGAAHPAARMVIFENTGARGMLGRLVIEATLGARIVITGIAAGEESLIPLVAIMKGLQLTFVIYYTPEEFAEALQLIADGKLDWQTLVTGKVPLDQVNEAFQALEDPEIHAKILIDPRLAPG